MKQKILTLSVALLISFASYAQAQQSYQCTMSENVRRVEVVSEPGVTVPCEVHYFKDSESPGEQQILWRALNEEGYCEAKAAEFVQSLGEMGWSCGEANSVREPNDTDLPAASDDGENLDDTADLAPAEDLEMEEEQR